MDTPVRTGYNAAPAAASHAFSQFALRADKSASRYDQQSEKCGSVGHNITRPIGSPQGLLVRSWKPKARLPPLTPIPMHPHIWYFPILSEQSAPWDIVNPPAKPAEMWGGKLRSLMWL